MKKIFITFLAAAAALSACTKSEPVYESSGQIGFAPVAQNITKSVAGVGADGTFDATFPTDLNLYIFANAQADDLSESWPAAYFRNAKFIYSRIADNTVYEGDPARYWPNVKSLIFAGYSNACNIDAVAANSTMDFDGNTLTIKGYTQDNTKTGKGANDLMWFPWDSKSYSKQEQAVAVNMKHACSWITVKVLTDGKYADVKLHDLTVNGLYKTGDAVCGSTAATWTVSGTTSSEKLYENTEGAAVTAEAAPFETTPNNMVVLPQTPTTIDVTYSFVPQDGVPAIKETKTGLSLQYNGDAKWESGKHYIYTVTITATEILISPTVAAWTDVQVTPGTTI